MDPHRPSARRLILAAAAAVVAGVIASAVGVPWQLTVLCVWIAAGAVLLADVWRHILRTDAAATARKATIEDDTRAVARAVIVAASTVSLVGAGLALHKADSTSDAMQAVLTSGALIAIAVSWLVVNTEFTLHYAHLYFTPPAGGVEFPGVDEPDYRDFAYLAFTIGMAYQVSDTGLRTPRFRRTLLGHALLSYVFGAVIVAATINVAAGFIR